MAAGVEVWTYQFPAKGGYPAGVSAQTWLQDSRIAIGGVSQQIAGLKNDIAVLRNEVDGIRSGLTDVSTLAVRLLAILEALDGQGPDLAAIVAAVKQAIEEETSAIADAVNDETARRLES